MYFQLTDQDDGDDINAEEIDDELNEETHGGVDEPNTAANAGAKKKKKNKKKKKKGQETSSSFSAPEQVSKLGYI